MEIKGYKIVPYSEFLTILGTVHSEYTEGEGSNFKLADEMKVKTVQTVLNCFSPIKQKVSDAVMTNLMMCLGIHGCIMWYGGERYYYIKIKQ
jgi:hypothetical protein